MVLRKRGDVIAKKATTIAIVNQKGGTAKTTTCENLGIGLAMEGKKVLLVDVDPQGSLTISMGWQQPDELSTTLSTLMAKAMNDQSIQPGEGILHHAEGVDLIPANIELAGMEVALVNSMNREKMLKQVLDSAKREYDYILLDCTPSLGMLTVNALAAADTTLIPMQAQYLSAKGLEQLLQTIGKVRRQINPKLKIEGILLTMTDNRTIYGQQISNLIRQGYGKHLKVFNQTIPRSIRAAEISTTGKSIYQHDPKGKVAEAYHSIAKEVVADAEKRLKRNAERDACFFVEQFEYAKSHEWHKLDADSCNNQLNYIVDCLVKQGYIESETTYTNGKRPITLTPKGYERLDDIRVELNSQKDALVAMQFGEETIKTREAIKEGIRNAGYRPVLIDEVEHNDFITPEILKHIKESKFVVVDLTHQNNGAYFEEGYAMGLGKPVIQLCKVGEKLHFDIQQKNTIFWECEEEIADRLKKRILATIE